MSSEPSLEQAQAVTNSLSAQTLIRALRQWLADWLPALPLLVVAFGLLIAPAGALVIESFRSTAGGMTLEYWAKTFSSPGDQRAIITSLLLGATCATISLIVGGPVAWFISRMRPAGRSTWLASLNVAANFGGIGLAFAYIATLGTYGMVTLLVQEVGITAGPPSPASFWGLVLAYEYTNIPLFVLLTIPAMNILRHEWWEAAQTASATRWQFWRMVGIPILTPFLSASWLLIFTWSIGLYGLPFALGGASSSGQLRLITLQMGRALQASFSGLQRVAVLSVILMILAAISLLTYRAILRRALKWFS